MIRSVSAVLAMVLALAGIIAWECLDAPPADAPPPPRLVADVPSSHPEAPEARQGRMEGQAAAVLARPLFSRTRRPPQEAEAEAGAAPGKPPPRLTGTLVSQAGRWAIFTPAAGGKTVATGVGGHIGVFVVSAITAGEVTVLDPSGGAQVLRPKADPAIRAAAAPTVPAAPAAQVSSPSVLDLLQSIPGEGTKPGPPGAARPGAARTAAAR